jgi:cytochrome c-type biogenesis protein CcmE
MEWATKRRLLYGTVTVFFTLAVATFIFQNTLFPDPTCFDTKKNGFEVGVDCGGVCSLKCVSEITPIQVRWARTLPVGEDRYDIVGLVENKNIDNAPRDLPYQFTIYNAEGRLIFTYNGTTTVPVSDDKPIIIQNKVVNGIPDKTLLTLSPVSHYVAKEAPREAILKTLRVRHEEGEIPRVYVTVQNTTQDTFASLPVRVILYDEDKNAIGAGETIIPFLNKEEQKELVFTWNQPFTKPVASTRVYYDLKAF